jgi:hypothetical protein
MKIQCLPAQAVSYGIMLAAGVSVILMLSVSACNQQATENSGATIDSAINKSLDMFFIPKA